MQILNVLKFFYEFDWIKLALRFNISNTLLEYGTGVKLYLNCHLRVFRFAVSLIIISYIFLESMNWNVSKYYISIMHSLNVNKNVIMLMHIV